MRAVAFDHHGWSKSQHSPVALHSSRAYLCIIFMITSSNGNIFRVTGPLWGESTSHRRIFFTTAIDAVLRCFLWSAPERFNEQSRRWWFQTPSCSLWRHWNISYHVGQQLIGMVAFFSCDQQLNEWYCLSVCPSVRPSVRLSATPFWLCSHQGIIMKFSGVIINEWSDVHAKGQGQRSKVKVTEVDTQISRFRTLTPVWSHIWWWNDAQSLMLLRKGALLFFKVIHRISRSHD